MRHGFSYVLPHNLSIIYPDNVLTFIVRYDVGKRHINCEGHNAVALALLKQQNVPTR